MRSFGELQYAKNYLKLLLVNLYLPDVMAITDFFQEFLRTVIQEIS
jgi:hypothetical protein